MGSNINPLYPTSGTATTDQIRTNFLTGKTEIEALQSSTDSNGLKVTSNDTLGLGAALGGTADGRIAYDTDKEVLVRDTDSGSPFWLELGQRRIKKGGTTARPDAGDISDGNYCNLFYNTDTSKFQLDNGSTWVDIGPGPGGSGGGTLTENVVPAMISGDTFQVTHPSVPLTGAGSGEIKFALLGAIAGSSSTLDFTYPIYKDLNVNGATWIQDSGADGHFSVAPGAEVGLHSLVSIGLSYTIDAFTPPGTNPSEVTLSSPVASNPINVITDVTDFSGLDLLPTGSGPVYADVSIMSWGYVYGLPYVTALKIETITGLSMQVVGAGLGRAAVTFNGIAAIPQWWSYDGTDWFALNTLGVALNPADLESDGLQVSALVENVKDNAGVVIPIDDGTPGATGWGQLRLLMQAYGSSLSFGFLCGLKNVACDSTQLQSIVFSYQTKDLISTTNSLGASTTGMGSSEFKVERIDDTHTSFYMGIGLPSMTDVHLQVWTA